MALFDQDPSELLDDNSLHPLKSLGIHYPSYLKWMNFCSVVVAFYAFGGLLLFGASIFSVVPDLLQRIFYSHYARIEEYFIVVFILGSFLCCTCLLWGCWRTFQYHHALRSAIFVDGTDANRWVHASVQGHRLWKTCAGATLALVLGWAPLLMYVGYDEIEHHLWKWEDGPPIPEAIPVEEVWDDVPAEVVDLPEEETIE